MPQMDVPPLPSSLWWDETPSVGGSGGVGRGGVAAIRENMTHSVGGEFFALRAVTVAIFPHNRSSTHDLALPLPRLRFDYGVTRKVQAASDTQSGDGATVRYPLRRLRQKKMAVAKPTIPKMAP